MSQRTCPRDQSLLDPFQRGKTTLDRCPTCKGIWCDRDELAQVVGTVEDLPGYTDSLDGIRASCPGCQQPLLRQFYSSDRVVVVDVCEQCRGVWLDDNELAEIICRAHGFI